MADASSVRRMVGPKSCADGATAAHEKIPAAAHAALVARIDGTDCIIVKEFSHAAENCAN
jgi:hypothetical protein